VTCEKEIGKMGERRVEKEKKIRRRKIKEIGKNGIKEV
jgi:hypothetical protein